MRAPEFRLRTPSAGLLALPWDRPLSQWNVPDVPLRDIAVGPSRHLVKFVEADDALWAVKDMPQRIAAKEYDVLRRLEEMGLPAVRPAGLVAAARVRHRDPGHPLPRGVLAVPRLFMRLPPDQPKHRARLLDGMAGLLVELHRHGVFWGDCSLANTLFSRDGQTSAGLARRRRDLRGAPHIEPGATRARPRNHGGERGDGHGRSRRAARSARGDARHADRRSRTGSASATKRSGRSCTPSRSSGSATGTASKGTIRRLNELGFAVDELSLQPDGADPSRLKLRVAVGDRRYHAQRLQELTGLDVGEGQARILLGDLRAYQAQLCREVGPRRRRADGRPAVGDRGGDTLRAVGTRGGEPHRHAPSRPTAICSRCVGCSARRPATTSAPTERSRHWPGTSSPLTPLRRWPSPRCRPHRLRSWQSDDDS